MVFASSRATPACSRTSLTASILRPLANRSATASRTDDDNNIGGPLRHRTDAQVQHRFRGPKTRPVVGVTGRTAPPRAAGQSTALSYSVPRSQDPSLGPHFPEAPPRNLEQERPMAGSSLVVRGSPTP